MFHRFIVELFLRECFLIAKSFSNRSLVETSGIPMVSTKKAVRVLLFTVERAGSKAYFILK